MTFLAVYPDANSPGKSDMSGAFRPEALAFVELHGGQVVTFPARRPFGHRLTPVLDALRAVPRHSLQCVALFCHGWKDGLQCGVDLDMKTRHLDLVAALRHALSRDWAVVWLAACDAARDLDDDREDDRKAGPGGDGGYADALRDAMAGHCRLGWIDAHATTGHATRNPWVRRFHMHHGSGEGGDWLVAPGSPLWPRWRRALRGELRRTYPLLSAPTIHDELREGSVMGEA